MARGDITTVITANMAQNDATDRQPAAGVEELWLAGADVDDGGSAPDSAPANSLLLVDGTNNEAEYFHQSTTGLAAANFRDGKYAADNTRFFRLLHRGTSTGDYGLAVIEVG